MTFCDHETPFFLNLNFEVRTRVTESIEIRELTVYGPSQCFRYFFLFTSAFTKRVMIVLSVVLFLTALQKTDCITLTLRPHAVECFTEHPIELHDIVTGSFFVENIDSKSERNFFMSVEGPDQREVYNTGGEAEHRFEYKVNKAGMHRVCFTNKGAKTGKLAYFSHIGHHWDHGKATKTHLDPAMEALQNLDAKVALVTEESRYHKRRAKRHARTTESTQKRVIIMASIEALTMIGSTLLQLQHVTRLFFRRESFDQQRVSGSRFGV